MNIYAYTSVFEVVAKLGICYLIGVGDFDRLMVYATMIFIVQMSLLLFYRFYCSRKFAEAKYQIKGFSNQFCHFLVGAWLQEFRVRYQVKEFSYF